MPDSRALLQTALADRYTIHHELGRGGMATVHLATDLRNKRRVALKVLADDVTSAISLARFLREIEIAGRLDHPHILPLLDSGAADGLAYYTMPYVDGESLRTRLRREKQLPLDDAVRIATEVADALGHAHARGIVHRDIKPDNILLADGHARVADFGIARALLGGAEDDGITATGLAIGTPPYMSPEQIAGGRDVDERSDIYSLGCVLYEMLAGEPPYTGASAQAILAKRLKEPVPRVTVLRETVPPHIERAIERALARAPADRFPSATAFAEALASPTAMLATRGSSWSRRVAAGLVVTAVVLAAGVGLWQYLARDTVPDGNADVIAVFPFRVHAQDSSAFYLREAALDYLSAQFTGEGSPRAVDSRAVLQAVGRATRDGSADLTASEALTVARRLGAGRVLLGEIVATPGGTTVSGRILDGRGALLAERRESGSADPILLIDRLAGRLLAESAGETPWRLTRLSDSLEAVKEYLAGVRAHRRGEDDRSIAHYDRALEIDSAFALAAMRATESGGRNISEILRRTERAWRLRGRLSLRDRTVVEAHFAIGPNYPRRSTTVERIRAHEQAAALNPGAADVLLRFGIDLLVFGEQAGFVDTRTRAVALLDSALALDSTYGPAAQWRLEAALAMQDSAAIRTLLPLEEALNPDADDLDTRWAGLTVVGDTAGLTRLLRRAVSRAAGLRTLSAGGALHGLPLHDVEAWIKTWLSSGHAIPVERNRAVRDLFHIAVMQGRHADAIAQADSPANRDLILAMAIAEPGYDSAAGVIVSRLDQVHDTTLDADAVCYRELWRVKHGDTSATRASMRRVREVVAGRPPAPFPRVGPFGVCPLLLEMMMARADDAALLPALERLEATLRDGVGLEMPGELATLLVARARYERGDYAIGYDIVRRRPFIHNVFFTVVLPAHLREEGRLAAALGDTAGAIRAYRHYLALRVRPDPGPATEEVRQVRDHLRALLRSSERQAGAP